MAISESQRAELERLMARRTLSRRSVIIGGSSAAAMAFLAACGSDSGGGAGPDTTAGSGGDTDAEVTTTEGAAPAPTGDVKTGGILRIGMVGSTNDLIDGQHIVGKTDQARLLMGWETLVTNDENFELTYENGLARDIEAVAPDHYIVHLKEGITFHDGKPLTADDVIYSFERRLDPDLGLSPSLPTLLDTSGLTKVDDLTVDIKLKQGAVTFLVGLAEYTATIVPVGYSRDDEVQIGTGPFMLESFTSGAESVHKRNPNYWGGAELPYLDEVQIIDFADATALVNALSSGQVDVIADVPFAQAGTLKETPDVELLVSQAGSWLPITMAIDQAPFDDVRVRQAMRLIVDREQMVERVLSGYGSVGNDMYGVLDGSYPHEFPQRVQDIEGAMALLAEAGQENLEIDLFAPDDTAGLPELAAAFAEQAKLAGVTVNVKVLDGGTYWGEEYTKRTFATSFWGTRDYLNQAAAGSITNAVYPETHWPPADSNFDELYLQALAETDEDKRNAIIREMQTMEYEDGGNIISIFNNLLDAYASYVQGFQARPNLLNLDHFGRGMKTIWMDT